MVVQLPGKNLTFRKYELAHREGGTAYYMVLLDRYVEGKTSVKKLKNMLKSSRDDRYNCEIKKAIELIKYPSKCYTHLRELDTCIKKSIEQLVEPLKTGGEKIDYLNRIKSSIRKLKLNSKLKLELASKAVPALLSVLGVEKYSSDLEKDWKQAMCDSYGKKLNIDICKNGHVFGVIANTDVLDVGGWEGFIMESVVDCVEHNASEMEYILNRYWKGD